MQTSLFLARLIGPFLIVIGAGMLANRAGYRAMTEELLRSRVLVYFAGVLALVPGLALVLTHNVWVADWRILITLLGWFAFIGGTFHIVFPGQVMSRGMAAVANNNVMIFRAGIMLLLGDVLFYYGYFA